MRNGEERPARSRFVEPPFSDRERETLARLADALVPRAWDVPGLEASASDLGTPVRVEATLRGVLPPSACREFRQVLALLDSGVACGLVDGRLRGVRGRSPVEVERLLLALADARLPVARRVFLGVRKLVAFHQYTDPRTHGAFGYAAPPASAEPPADAPPLRSWGGGAVDVVVVGSGAGGGVVAGVLAGAGLRVLVVEQGPLVVPREFDGREPEGNERLYEGAGAFATEDGAVSILAGRAAGGGTTVNWMTSLAPPGWLLDEWREAGVEDDLAPHVAAVEARAHVTAEESSENGPNRVLREGAERLGWSWTRLRRNARGCRARCGFCAFGCPWSAKQGTLVTWLADAAAQGARFAFGARVERVLVEGGRAVGVALADGRQVRARAVVLAGGAVHTPALLLRSGVRARGLGRIYLHPVTAVVGVLPDPVPMWEGPMQTVAVTEHGNLDGRHHGVLFEAVPAHPGLAAASLPWRGGASAKRDMADLARTAALIAIARDERPGRVAVDRGGNPVVRYRVGPADGARLLDGVAGLARLLAAAGATRLSTLHTRGVRAEGPLTGGRVDGFVAEARAAGVAPHSIGLFSAHQMGSCALGRDGEAPADAATARLWDVESLYVADASAFPTPSGVNPMISIQALAHRAATKLAAALS